MRHQVVKSVALFSGTNILAAAIPLLLLPILTRVLTAADYGLVAMYALVITAFGALTGLSAHGAVGMRYFDRTEIDYPRYIGNAMILLFVTSTCVFAIVLLAAGPLEELTQLPRKWLLIGVGVSALQFVLLIRLSVYQSAKQAGSFATFRISQALVDAGLSIVLVLGLALAWEGRLIGQSAAIVLLGIVASVSLAVGGWVKLEPDRKYIAGLLKFGVPLVPHVVGGMLLTSVDRIFIANVIGISQTGVYLVAVQISLGIYLIADACNRAISPWLIETLKMADPAKDIRITRYTLLYFLFLMCSAIAVGIGSIWALPLVVGPAFGGAAKLIWITAIAQSFAGMYLIVANVIFYQEKTAFLSVITISCGILGAVLSYLFLHIFGLVGAAVAQLIAQATMFTGALLFAQHLRPLPWFAALFPTRVRTTD